MTAYITQAALDTYDERARQDAKWGEQNHPDGTGPGVELLALVDASSSQYLAGAIASHLADAATTATNLAAKSKEVTWRDILLEEVFEALAEDDAAKLRTELVQVAAVAQQWVEAIDRREAGAVSA